MSKTDLAIVTMSYGTNYGNKLQNYAMQVVYESMGFSVETIKLKPAISYSSTLKEKLNNIGSKILKRLKCKIYKSYINKRRENFEEFNAKHINFTLKEFDMNSYSELNDEKYQIYSVGSDQVWNSYFDEFSGVYLLDCLDNSKIRISYAASLGCETINPIYEDKFENELNKFKAISVREDEGKKVLEDSYGLPVEVVVDPTLLLEKKEWDRLIENSKFKENNKYVLTYFLGEMGSKLKKYITCYARKNELKIIHLNRMSTQYYSAGPVEFVDMIKNAHMIFTDSFHACCFSIIYEKPFWVVSRNSVKKNMNSRINTLLKNLKLETRWWNENVDVESIPDFQTAYINLNELKRNSYKFLEKSIV